MEEIPNYSRPSSYTAGGSRKRNDWEDLPRAAIVFSQHFSLSAALPFSALKYAFFLLITRVSR